MGGAKNRAQGCYGVSCHQLNPPSSHPGSHQSSDSQHCRSVTTIYEIPPKTPTTKIVGLKFDAHQQNMISFKTHLPSHVSSVGVMFPSENLARPCRVRDEGMISHCVEPGTLFPLFPTKMATSSDPAIVSPPDDKLSTTPEQSTAGGRCLDDGNLCPFPRQQLGLVAELHSG